MQDEAPPLQGVLETSLYVEDLDRATRFYGDALGFPVLVRSQRLVAFDAGRASVLLLFPKGDLPDMADARGLVPGHGGGGRLHVAFAIGADDLPAWRDRLAGGRVALVGEYRWPRGGTSLYFHDPRRPCRRARDAGIMGDLLSAPRIR